VLFFFYHAVKIVKSKLRNLVCGDRLPQFHGLWPHFDDMVYICNRSALVKRIFSQNGIIGVNFNWLAKFILKNKSALINNYMLLFIILSTLINTVLNILSRITLKKHQHLQQLV